MQRTKTGFAHHTLEHHAPGDLDGRAQREQLGCILGLKGFKQGGSLGVGLEVVGKGHAFALRLACTDRFELLAPLVHELVFIKGGGWGAGFRHGRMGQGNGMWRASVGRAKRHFKSEDGAAMILRHLCHLCRGTNPPT